ncbi:hypothetical protein [Aeromonas sanarellii]|uniref:hypothetical protein n=1 Tax=Aeromonas sanarellii TaxID=633415 RepID=UPI00398666C0
MLFTDTDEGDDGVGSVIDTTKVTSSTPADQPLPQPCDGTIRRSLQPGSAALNQTSGGRKPGRKTIARAKNGLCSMPKTLGAVAKLFGFAIELAGHHQVKPNKNEPIID